MELWQACRRRVKMGRYLREFSHARVCALFAWAANARTRVHGRHHL
jgi:hypothetical protein